MSSRVEHDSLGFTLGAVTAITHAAASGERLSLADVVAAGLGGGIGGIVGARVPDALEPATSSWHRSTAHSLAAMTGAAYLGATRAVPLATRLHAAADNTNDGVARLLERFGAGALVGAPVGLVSHMLADAQTARGIPMLVRGF